MTGRGTFSRKGEGEGRGERNDLFLCEMIYSLPIVVSSTHYRAGCLLNCGQVLCKAQS